jgi:hypothetical protein
MRTAMEHRVTSLDLDRLTHSPCRGQWLQGTEKRHVVESPWRDEIHAASSHVPIGPSRGRRERSVTEPRAALPISARRWLAWPAIAASHRLLSGQSQMNRNTS